MIEFTDIQAVHRLEVATILSPEFTMPVPHVQNLHLIPQPILDAMRPGWLTGHHAPRPVTLTKLFDVFVTEEGLVFTAEKKLITQSVTQHTQDECHRAFMRVQSAHSVPEIRPSALLLRKRGDHNYGHWLIEVLPKLWVAEQYMERPILVVPELSAAMTHVVRDSIALSSHHQPEFLTMRNDDVCFFKELVMVNGLTDHGVYMSPLVFGRTDAMRACVPDGSPQNLYVKRSNSNRQLTDYADIEVMLNRYGFKGVDPSELTFLEQIKVFKAARIVVGVMGAGLTNIAFCSPSTKIITLAPAVMPDTFFAFIAALRGLDYHEVRGPMQAEQTTGWDEPFSIMPSQLEALLAA